MDGRHTLPDTHATKCANGDELARVGLQHEANDQSHWNRLADRGDAGVLTPAAVLFKNTAAFVRRA